MACSHSEISRVYRKVELGSTEDNSIALSNLTHFKPIASKILSLKKQAPFLHMKAMAVIIVT